MNGRINTTERHSANISGLFWWESLKYKYQVSESVMAWANIYGLNHEIASLVAVFIYLFILFPKFKF